MSGRTANGVRVAQVRWGVLSTANIGAKAVAPAIARSANGRLLAVASRSGDKAARYAETFGMERHYGSYQALLADQDIDAVYIPLPNSLHLEWTIKALESGKHVLCEKPLALSVAECLRMEEAARLSGRVLMEAFMYRFHPRIALARELVASGRLGTVRLIRAAFGFTVADPTNIRLQPELGGGSLMDVGCYCVDVARLLLAAEPDEASARAVWSGSGVDVHLIGRLGFGNACLSFDCSLDTVRQEYVEVVGTEGRLRLDKAFLPGTAATAIDLVTRAEGETRFEVQGVDEYQLMVERFADAVLAGSAPDYTARHAAAGMAALEALYASAHSRGETVPVTPLPTNPPPPP